MAKAKRKPARTKAPSSTVLSRLQGNLKELQRDTEAVLSRARKQATQLVSRDQRRTLERLVSQARRVGSDVEKRAQRATRQVEPRIQRFFSTLEKQTEKRFEDLLVRLIWRLGLVSQKDLRSLSLRLDQIEHRLKLRRRTPPRKARTAEATAPQPSETTLPASP